MIYHIEMSLHTEKNWFAHKRMLILIKVNREQVTKSRQEINKDQNARRPGGHIQSTLRLLVTLTHDSNTPITINCPAKTGQSKLPFTLHYSPRAVVLSLIWIKTQRREREIERKKAPRQMTVPIGHLYFDLVRKKCLPEFMR